MSDHFKPDLCLLLPRGRVLPLCPMRKNSEFLAEGQGRKLLHSRFPHHQARPRVATRRIPDATPSSRAISECFTRRRSAYRPSRPSRPGGLFCSLKRGRVRLDVQIWFTSNPQGVRKKRILRDPAPCNITESPAQHSHACCKECCTLTIPHC